MMKFGTSGLRGLVTDMTDEACAAHVSAFLGHLARTGAPAPALLIGRDLRPSSPRIAAATAAAAQRAGVESVECGVLPTPALALEAAARRLPAVMVTGSHIPFDRNGLKFYRRDGEIDKSDEAGVLAALDDPAAPAASPAASRRDDGVAARYAARLREFFPADMLGGRRIGVWQHSAAGRDLTVEILRGFGAETVELGRSDDFVPVDTEAVSAEDEAQARRWTEAHRLDALVSTDGDGDRPLIADERGVYLRGDLLGVLTARYLGADAVATPVSSNTALERSGWFARVARTRIGSPHVIAAMAELARAGARLPVAYEANGGFLLGGTARAKSGATLSPLPTRDAMTPVLSVLAMAASRGVALSALADDLPGRFTASDRIREAPSAKSAALLQTLADDAAERRAFLAGAGLGEAESLDRTDGLRMRLQGDEIVHLRPSGNAPELRVYAEAGSAERARDLVRLGLEAARARL